MFHFQACQLQIMNAGSLTQEQVKLAQHLDAIPDDKVTSTDVIYQHIASVVVLSFASNSIQPAQLGVEHVYVKCLFFFSYRCHLRYSSIPLQ